MNKNLSNKLATILIPIILLSLLTCTNAKTLKVPPGFAINTYTNKVPGARQMALGNNGVVFVGSYMTGRVYEVFPNPTHTKAEKVEMVSNGLTLPNGVAYHQGNLYIAGLKKILRYTNIDRKPRSKPTVIINQLPGGSRHGRRYIKFGPDGKLYVPLGSPCNACVSSDPRFATIMRMDANGQHFEIFARGVRNTVGFDWEPGTNTLWFTDNGMDYLGDNLPPDEINIAGKPNLNFGYPYYYGNNVRYSKLKLTTAIQNLTAPAFELPAHVAPLGMIFYTGDQFPKQYENALFIAEHGSWNRSKKIGYQVIAVFHKGNKITKVVPFITGWLKQQFAWGRPVDVLQMPDGSILVSDDRAGAIYRITYNP